LRGNKPPKLKPGAKSQIKNRQSQILNLFCFECRFCKNVIQKLGRFKIADF